MPDRPKHSADRERTITSSLGKLGKLISSFQKSLVDSIYEFFVDRFKTKDNKITVDGTNFTAVNGLQDIYDQWNEPKKQSILKLVIDSLTDLHGNNSDYFGAIVGTDITPDSEKIFLDMMRRLGYDRSKGRLTVGGYLQSVMDSNDPVIRLKVAALRAIVSKQSLADFKKSLDIIARGDVDHEGILEKHYGTHMYDVFQQYDREVGRLLAEKLGLKYAIYQGGLIKTSRPFCVHRNDKVFTIQEISLFGTPKDKYGGYQDKSIGYFQGKPPVYNPFLDCGGYNCRHVMDWLSNELGEILYKQQQSKGSQAPNEFGHIQMSVEDFEKDIVNLKNEKGGMYNRDGVLQDVTGGTVNQIKLNHLTGTDTYNFTFTHNHPSWVKDPRKEGNSFSKADIITAINMGFREIRAVTGASVHRMIFEDTFTIGFTEIEKGKAFSIFKKDKNLSAVQNLIKRSEASVRKILQRKLNADEITESEANFLHWDLVWQEFIKKTKGITYAKEKR